MTVLEYVARFTELARFGDDYVATDAAKVRRFEDGLKLSIRGKIVGLKLARFCLCRGASDFGCCADCDFPGIDSQETDCGGLQELKANKPSGWPIQNLNKSVGQQNQKSLGQGHF